MICTLRLMDTSKKKNSKFYACQWAIRSRKKDVKNLDKIVKINEKELNQVHWKKNEKTLGVAMGLSLTWDNQFMLMVNKMKEAIGKLKNAEIMMSTASMCYNMHLCKKVHFGSGIFS